MAIDISALSAFRHVATWVDDSVANVAYGNEIWSPGLYEGKFKAAFTSRSQNDKDANNAVRTALLKALGNACGLAYGEGDRFSDDFMNRLQQLIGKDFNRSDFGIDSNGQVKSGRPLTARRINAILARVDAAKSQGFVDDAINYLQSNAKLGSRVATTFPLSKSERKMAIEIVGRRGVGLSDVTRGVLARFVVNAISRKKYDGLGAAAMKEEVDDIALKTAQSLKEVRPCEYKPTELFQARLDKVLQDADNYVRNGVFNLFMSDGDTGKYTIQGQACGKRSQAIAQLKTYVRNSNHRKAISTVMGQQFNKIVPIDGLTKERDSETKLTVEGKKATVTVKTLHDIRFNVEDANEWADVPMGAITHETKFEFDLSDENEAKLASVDFKQTI